MEKDLILKTAMERLLRNEFIQKNNELKTIIDGLLDSIVDDFLKEEENLEQYTREIESSKEFLISIALMKWMANTTNKAMSNRKQIIERKLLILRNDLKLIKTDDPIMKKLFELLSESIG